MAANLPKRAIRPPSDLISKALFDACIDCLYEYDLGATLPGHWPLSVRGAITASRNRIMQRHRNLSRNYR